MGKAQTPFDHSAELFKGTAQYYAKYRIGYPKELLDSIAAEFHLDGTGRLLDLGCGTGQLAIPLHARFEEVVGVDISAEMIAEAKHQAQQASVTNIRWIQMPVEQISPELGRFRLVTCGSSFHWMNREEVLRRSYGLLSPEGGIAILGGRSFWGGEQEWEQAVVRVVKRWLGEERRAGKGVFPKSLERHEEVVARSAFKWMKMGEHRLRHVWDIASIIGHLYSTSYCRRSLLGNKAQAFEEDLQNTLLEIDPTGRFEQEIVIGYIFAWKR